MIEIIAEHSIETSKLNLALPVLDVGARRFDFSKEMARRGFKVVAMEPDPEVKDPHIAGVNFQPAALSTANGISYFKMTDDPQARHLSPAGERLVNTVTIDALMALLSIDKWSVVKLDCEGAEMSILENWPGPIADQLTVEMHEHTMRQPPARYEAMFRHLSQWYDVKRHVLDDRHCAGLNYWDSLLVLR